MSKGSDIISIRVKKELHAKMKAELERRNNHPLLEPMSVTDFIWKAIEEKIAHMERSRQGRRVKVNGVFVDDGKEGSVIHHG